MDLDCKDITFFTLVQFFIKKDISVPLKKGCIKN